MTTAAIGTLSLNSDSPSKILVIGETGSGKSTFINYLTNYFKNGTLDNLRVTIKTKFRPATEGYSHSETNTNDTSKSQTTACAQYKFTRRGRDYIFLDTPGLGDTRGIDQDDKNVEKIITSVESFDGITCVLIVMNGTVPRRTLNVQNVIVRLQGFLPDVIMEHVIIVLTNAYRYAASADLEKILNFQSIIHPFYMQNSAFSTDPSKWDQQAMKCLQSDWEVSITELKNLIDLIDTFEVKSVKAFTDMKTLRNDIKTMMHKARLEVENIQKMQDEIAGLQTGMKGYEDNITKNQDYISKKIVLVEELVDASYHSTLCTECNHVCHDHCQLNETHTKGDQTLSGCACMGGTNQCKQCRGHCSYTLHYHAQKTMKKANKTVEEVLHDIKAKFDAATTNKTDAQKKLTSACDQKNMLEKALQQKDKEIKKKCLELKKHCSGFNIVAELNIMIKQLETSKQNIKDLDALRQADTFINSLKTFCNRLEADNEFSDTKNKKQMIIQDDYRPASVFGSTVIPKKASHDDMQDENNVKKDGDITLQNIRPYSQSIGNGCLDSPASDKIYFIGNKQQTFFQPGTSKGLSGKQIYVTGFPEGSVDRDDLEKYFSNYGNAFGGLVPIYPNGKLKGFGFVEFDNPNTVDEVLRKSHTINGYDVQVSLARPNPKARRYQQQTSSSSLFSPPKNTFYRENRGRRSFRARRECADQQFARLVGNEDNFEFSNSSEDTNSYGDSIHGKQQFSQENNRSPYYNNNRGSPSVRIHHGNADRREYSEDKESDDEDTSSQQFHAASRFGSGFGRGDKRGHNYRGRGFK